jgi:hypothetical protein
MFEILLASHLCCHSIEDIDYNVNQKINEIIQRVENLPKDPYEYGYLKGEFDTYLYIKTLLNRPVFWADL